jgi:hypothetical protein
MRTDMPSAAKQKRKGERGSPCHRPQDVVNSEVGEPLIKTDSLADETYAIIHFLQRAPKFM